MSIRQQHILAELVKRAWQIQEICGADVQYEVDWDTFSGDDGALENIERVSGYAVQRALQTICNEETRKADIRHGVHPVRLTNVQDVVEETLLLRDGILEIREAYADGRSAARDHEAVRVAIDKGLGSSQSDAIICFEKSMDIGWEQWRDGIGYDVDALGHMNAAERALIERTLIRRLSAAGNWRDVDALEALGTPAALDAVTRARKHPDVNVAIGHQRAQGPADSDLEDDVVRIIREGALDPARECPTGRAKRALLDLSFSGGATLRVNVAALLLYLCGQAREPFDWRQRPFFLRFGEGDPTEIQATWDELRRRTGA